MRIELPDEVGEALQASYLGHITRVKVYC